MPIKLKSGSEPVSVDDDDRYVCVNVPTDANTALAVELGDDVEIVIKGKVKSVHATKGEDVWGTPGDIRVEVNSIEVEGKNAFAALVED